MNFVDLVVFDKVVDLNVADCIERMLVAVVAVVDKGSLVPYPASQLAQE